MLRDKIVQIEDEVRKNNDRTAQSMKVRVHVKFTCFVYRWL